MVTIRTIDPDELPSGIEVDAAKLMEVLDRAERLLDAGDSGSKTQEAVEAARRFVVDLESQLDECPDEQLTHGLLQRIVALRVRVKAVVGQLANLQLLQTNGSTVPRSLH